MEGLKKLRLAAKGGYGPALLVYAQEVRDMGAAFRFMEGEAQNGNILAMVQTARWLRDGIGVERDIDRAVKMLRNAVAAGNVVAEKDLKRALAMQAKQKKKKDETTD
jgi:TPR repeat protein